MAKKKTDLFGRLQNVVGAATKRGRRQKPPKAVQDVIARLGSTASDLEGRLTGRTAKRKAAGKKAAATRRRQATKRSAAAKKGARTRAKAR